MRLCQFVDFRPVATLVSTEQRKAGGRKAHLVPACLDLLQQGFAVPEQFPTQSLVRRRALDLGDDELAFRERGDGKSELLR